MSTVTIVLALTIVTGILLALYGVMIYNRLIALRNRFKNSFAQIDVQLKRRHDLLPNLIATAKGYMQHEQQTLERVVQARNQASDSLKAAASDPTNPEAIAQLSQAETKLAGAVGQFKVLIEAYPVLKASENMQQLSEELISTENRISFARQAYNDQVMEYNIYRESFPQNIFAAHFGHKQAAQLLELGERDQLDQVPTAQF